MSLTCISAPGKVLLAGGYLVLDRAHSGVVVSTSSRFYTVITSSGSTHSIVVRSPQFEAAEWTYHVDVKALPVKVKQQGSGSRNKFVELALQRTLALAVELSNPKTIEQALSSGLDIAIVGANDFYSQRASLASHNLPPTRASLASLPPFQSTGTTLKDVHKTGLGSSAALITSLVTALLVHTGIIPRFVLSAGPSDTSNTQEDETVQARRLAHNLAQHVHCLAQGKVGSGFDVSAAVFGSQLYTRFSPDVLEPLMMDELAADRSLNPIISAKNATWDYVVKPFRLPGHVQLMLADVDAGSDTPSLVGKVLKWRAAHKTEADKLWAELDAANGALATALTTLSSYEKENPDVYAQAVSTLASVVASEWKDRGIKPNERRIGDIGKIGQAMYEAHVAAESIRAHMRDMSARAGVPIEPPEQTELLDACTALPGVIGGGVPGAGGYDAVWVLVINPTSKYQVEGDEKPSARVEKVWQEWTKLDVSPLLAEESMEGGARLEDVDAVPGLKAAISVA